MCVNCPVITDNGTIYQLLYTKICNRAEFYCNYFSTYDVSVQNYHLVLTVVRVAVAKIRASTIVQKAYTFVPFAFRSFFTTACNKSFFDVIFYFLITNTLNLFDALCFFRISVLFFTHFPRFLWKKEEEIDLKLIIFMVFSII